MGIFGRCNLGGEQGDCGKKEEQGKSDNRCRIAKNPVQGEFQFSQSGMGGHDVDPSH
jgi:hypothetical protein